MAIRKTKVERQREAELQAQLQRDSMIAGRELAELALLRVGGADGLALYRTLPAEHSSDCACKSCGAGGQA